MQFIRVIAALLFLCVVLPTHGQTPVDADDVIRVDTDLTNLLMTATDKQRRFITTLRAEDIKVLEDGTPQKLFTFERETNRPLALAFLIDISSSEERTLPLEKRAARLFIERVIKSTTDQAAIIPFTGSAFLEQPLTNNVLAIYRALERVDIALPSYTGSGLRLSGIASGPGLAAPPEDGTTAIWEAILLTSRDILQPLPPSRRRAIILLTDGHDTTSRITRTEAVESVIGAESVIYAIGIGDSKEDGVNHGTLKDIAERTGGRAFFPKKEEDLNIAFAEIEQELRTQYLLAYSSSNKNRDGSYRKISVEITNPDLLKEKVQLRHRPGYYATSIH
ncbi:MAG TPA: VWA domain-containing protein [Pyrinomonadaceae bacterium]